MQSGQVVRHIAILDLIAVARKSAIDKQGVYTEIPTDPLEQSLWISKILRKYAKQLFRNCYIRRNKYSFSIRLDNPIFSEMYTVTSKGMRIDTGMYQDLEERRQVASLFNVLQESMRTHHCLHFKIRDDGKMFLYMYHQRDVYKHSEGSFMNVLISAEEISETWQTLYEEEFPRVKALVEEAEARNEEQEEERQRVVKERAQRIEREVEERRQLLQRQYEEQRLQQEQSRQSNRVVLRPVTAPSTTAPTVSEEAQNQFNEILRRVTNRDSTPEEIEEEIIVTLDESVLTNNPSSLTQILHMVPDDYTPGNNYLSALCPNTGLSETWVDRTFSALNSIQLPEGIPTVSIPFDKEYVLDVSRDIETALSEGPDGIYYLPVPLYHIVVDGKIIETKGTLEEAQRIYLEEKGNLSIPILYPVTEFDMGSINDALRAMIPSDVYEVEYSARLEAQGRELLFGGREND